MLTKNEKGFTLTELMVVIGIATVLMSVSLYDYKAFTDKLALSAAAQEMAIAIRQAQTYGLNVKEATAGGGDFTRAYGIYFSTLDPYNYYIFVDKNTVNKLYDVGSGACGTALTECIEKVSLRNGVSISSITNTNGCAVTNNATALHVTFIRPKPDANINFTNGSGTPCSGQTDAKIVLTSPKGKIASTSIEITGQVYTQ